MADKDGIHRILNELELARLGRLVVNSRFTVEGQLQGAHASPLKGFSVEFADYRQYVQGDDLRHLDWRAYARNERLYIRQYEEECNLRLYLLVDASTSMAYGHETAPKWAYAQKLAAALAYVTVQQQDSAGLTLFSADTTTTLPAKGGLAHLRTLANTLADIQPTGDTTLADTLHQAAQRIQRRALVVVISDFFDEPERLQEALAHLKRRRHDVVLYQVLDRAELEFPFRDLGNFRDLESGATVITNPRAVRRAYQEAIEAFLQTIRGIASNQDLDYNLLTTDQPFMRFIQEHLRKRQRQIG